jgi:hypothetical protein
MVVCGLYEETSKRSLIAWCGWRVGPIQIAKSPLGLTTKDDYYYEVIGLMDRQTRYLLSQNDR